MRAAAPFMSSFIVYLLGLAVTVGALRKARASLHRARYVAAGVFLFAGLAAALFSLTADERPVFANSRLLLAPNQPVGEAKGIYPGRVVWVWDKNSTNENCTNLFGDGWFLANNTNMSVVDVMVSDAVKGLAGKPNITERAMLGTLIAKRFSFEQIKSARAVGRMTLLLLR
jgi:hypothetical protein